MNKHHLTITCLVSCIIGFWTQSAITQDTLIKYASLIPALLIISIWSLKFKKYPLFFLLISFIYAGVYRLNLITKYENKKYDFEAIIVSYPDWRADNQYLVIIPTESIGSSPSQNPRRSLIKITTLPYPKYQYGDLIKVSGKISTPEIIEDFNYPLYLERQKIFGTIYHPQISLIEHNRGSPSLSWLYAQRSLFENRINKLLPQPASGFLSGILMGSKHALPKDYLNALRETGTSHIIAISGANIVIVLSIIKSLFPIYKPKSSLIATIIISSYLVIITGASASVIRGATIAILVTYIRYKSRRAWPLPLILVAIFLMSVLNPLILSDAGFLLSFSAFFGLLAYGSPLAIWATKYSPLKYFPRNVQAGFAETLAATLGTLPISLLLFGRISWLGLLINPIILWLLTPITLLGLIIITLPFLQDLVKIPLWIMLDFVLKIINYSGSNIKGSINLNIGIFTLLLILLSQYLLSKFLHRKLIVQNA